MAETNQTTPAQGFPEGSVPNQEYVDSKVGAELTDPVIADKTPSGPQRPEHIPEKFWDAEKGVVRTDDLAKSYAALEGKLRGKPAAEGETAEGETEGNPKETPESKKASNKIEREGQSKETPLTSAISSFAEAYAESNGEVTEDHIKALTDQGLPREIVDTYLAGLSALATQAATETYEIAGGQEKFAAAQEWAAKELSEADLEYFNANCDNPATRRQTVEWLMAKYNATQPNEGKIVEAGTPSAQGDVYTSQDQVTEAMNSRQYKTDPAFRKSVAEKLLRSQRAGTINTSTEFYKGSR